MDVGGSISDNNPYSFTAMTINMDGHFKAAQHREAVNYVLKVTNQADSPMKPDIVFAQQLGSKSAKSHWLLSDMSYDVMNTEKEAGIMWHSDIFTKIDKVDTGYVTRVLDTIKLQADSLQDIKSRTSIALLQRNKSSEDAPSYKLLAISWHGQRRIKEHKRKDIFKELQDFALKLCDTLKVKEYPGEDIAILIGGDFNIAFAKSTNYSKKYLTNAYLSRDFDYELYPLTSRRRQDKKEMLDNFVFTTNSIVLSDFMPFEPIPISMLPSTNSLSNSKIPKTTETKESSKSNYKQSKPIIDKPEAPKGSQSSDKVTQNNTLQKATMASKGSKLSESDTGENKTDAKVENVWIREGDTWHLYSQDPDVIKYLDHDPVLVTVHVK